jgi:hypothetical protein
MRERWKGGRRSGTVGQEEGTREEKEREEERPGSEIGLQNHPLAEAWWSFRQMDDGQRRGDELH